MSKDREIEAIALDLKEAVFLHAEYDPARARQLAKREFERGNLLGELISAAHLHSLGYRRKEACEGAAVAPSTTSATGLGPLPEGFVVVPFEPTAAMLDEGEVEAMCVDEPGWRNTARNVYIKMILTANPKEGEG